MFLAQALGSRDLAGIDIALVSNCMQQVSTEAVQNPARAMLFGPARVIPLELPGIECRSIDVGLNGGDVSKCADQILAEILAQNESKTVAFRGGERFIETLMPLTLPDVPESDRIQPGGVYVITGGLGGIGLIIAAHLAREFQAQLVLIGRTAIPPEAEWTALPSDFNVGDAERMRLKKLVQIKKDAGALLVVQGDVTDIEQMRSAVALTMKTFGKIDGVLHAAGVLEDGPLMLKTPESAARVLAPKVLGTLVLEEALRDVPVRDFILFSSISSIDPPAGQIDYAAANAFLDAFALSRQGAFRVINWGAWRGVGMAAARNFHHPLLDERLVDTPAATVDASLFSPSRQWVLREHAIKQAEELSAILPGTASLEMAVAAFAHTLPGHANEFQQIEFQKVEFQDVFFLAPLMLRGDEEREVRIQLRRDAEVSALEDAFRFSMFSRTSAWVEHSSGIISGCASPVPPGIDRLAIRSRCTQREIEFDEEHRTRQERHLVFGPRWHSLRSVLIGKGEALAEVALDDQLLADTSDFLIHPALLDVATGASFYLTDDYEHSNDLFLPVAYKRMRVYRPLPAKLYSHIRARKRVEVKSEVESFDITIFDSEGRVLVEIEGFSARRIADRALALQAEDQAGAAARSGGEQLIETGKPAGIDPMQGARELVRILSAKTPRAVIAVSEPLDELKAGATAPEQPADASVSAAPIAVGVEETLAQWWREMLGVDQAGLDDDFFDLGGHSLVAVRLLAKVRRTFRVDLEFAVLFEARSIRKLAGLIRASQTAKEDE
jgi:NAD(P)-dependent dehydrogenase (short-subunit alcohol dehydrogenase family)/acyl carrier protein